tara:strand:- start:55 stop:588 length:534 start_codon:yes stop_codon:yes gene_type:complete
MQVTDLTLEDAYNIAPQYSAGFHSGFPSHGYSNMTDGTVTVNTGAYMAYFPLDQVPTSIGLQWNSIPTINKARFHSTTTAARPKDFKVECSNDGSTYTKVSITGWSDGATQRATDEATASNADEWQTVTFPFQRAKYWRLTFINNVHNNGNDNAGMDEFEFWGFLGAVHPMSARLLG